MQQQSVAEKNIALAKRFALIIVLFFFFLREYIFTIKMNMIKTWDDNIISY